MDDLGILLESRKNVRECGTYVANCFRPYGAGRTDIVSSAVYPLERFLEACSEVIGYFVSPTHRVLAHNGEGRDAESDHGTSDDNPSGNDCVEGPEDRIIETNKCNAQSRERDSGANAFPRLRSHDMLAQFD